jgi:hypothetical protein
MGQEAVKRAFIYQIIRACLELAELDLFSLMFERCYKLG